MLPLRLDQVRALIPVRAVIDACVFPQTKNWLAPLLGAAREGYVELVWSPLIIAEANRVLTWLWLKRNGGDFSERSWQRCSVDAKRMFARLTPYFHVADDFPPGPDLWENPLDAWDIPIWTAAKQCDARFIVTANLADGPPKNAAGIQAYDGILLLDPDSFLQLLEFFADTDLLAALPDEETLAETSEGVTPTSSSGSITTDPSPVIRQLLQELVELRGT